jgi:hypothetical protein
VKQLIAQRQLSRPVLGVGDGATDAKLKEIVDMFAAYVGFARRANVIAVADLEIGSFGELERVVKEGIIGERE